MVEINVAANIIRLIVGVTILGYASYTDFKTRRASNYLWILMGGIGAILLVAQLISFTPQQFEIMKLYLIFIPIMIILVYILFQMRLIFGGADAKALMALAILMPFPTLQWLPESINLTLPLVETKLPYCWGAFINALILFLFIPIGLFIYNLSQKNIKIPQSFLGYKMDIQQARKKYVWPMEQIDENGEKKSVYMPKEYDIDEELDRFEEHNIEKIWVTPKIPFMIPLLFGFISVYVTGSFLTYLMNLF
ncbi:MAG: A24 family peptidase C-terminal domain-containing protein [Candidatus Thermoplasmatota archaeon]